MSATTFSGFSIKPVKKVRKQSSNKQVRNLLYCKPKLIDGVWYAYINTKGFEGYEDVTVLPFTARSLNTTNCCNIFSINKDKTNHYVHIIRDKETVFLHPVDEEKYSTLCENSVFKGYIIKLYNKLQFDMVSYVGHASINERLLTKSYSKEIEENDECEY